VQAQSIAAIVAAHAMGNALLLHSTLFPLLEANSLAMGHMDPSDIIGHPFPLHQLCKFVAFSLVWNLLVALACRMILITKSQTQNDGHQSGVVHVILMIWLYTVLIHLIIILCGIHPTIFPVHTLVSALYLAFNMLLPVLIFMPVNLTQPQYSHHHDSIVKEVPYKVKAVSNYLFGPPLTKEQPKKQHIHEQQKNQNRIQHIHQYAALGTAIGMGACAILRILDHGMQIQRYPIPIIVGATWGRCGGVLLGAMIVVISSSS